MPQPINERDKCCGQKTNERDTCKLIKGKYSSCPILRDTFLWFFPFHKSQHLSLENLAQRINRIPLKVFRRRKQKEKLVPRIH
jgi:hypothetical protein